MLPTVEGTVHHIIKKNNPFIRVSAIVKIDKAAPQNLWCCIYPLSRICIPVIDSTSNH